MVYMLYPHSKNTHTKMRTVISRPTYMPTRKIPHGKILARKYDHVEKFPQCKMRTQKNLRTKNPTPRNVYKNSIFGRCTFSLLL